jgi:DNA sulfur modification protein DndC
VPRAARSAPGQCQQPTANSQQPTASDVASGRELLSTIVAELRREYLSDQQSYPWIVGFSGGKDSTLVVQAVLCALLDIAPGHRAREVHIVSNDTQVESPLVMGYLRGVQERLGEAAAHLNLPVTISTTRPEPEHTFWVLLIGRGYPSPNQNMRWCTDRLKILPTSRYILDHVSRHGAAILVLGVRKDESQSRRASIERHRNLAGSSLTPHSSLAGAFIYRPIVNLSTDQVWEVLAENPPPWGGTHAELVQLYRDAEGGECPVVLSKDEVPGCGTRSSRFGCWTCTVVEKDRSLQGFVDAGRHQYRPLVEFRDWLREIRNDPRYRSVERRNGRIQFDSAGKHIPGPFTVHARQMILARLLQAQAEFGDTLIHPWEIDVIHALWAQDLAK